MAYKDFSLTDAIDLLGLRVRVAPLFSAVPRVEVPNWFLPALSRSRLLAPLTEMDRTSFLVGPFLMALHEVLDGAFSVHGGLKLEVDTSRGLTGECDYVISAVRGAATMELPIITAVEAKRQDVEAGLGQCIAQTYAARVYNASRGQDLDRMYGIVTTGDTWVFFRLAGDSILIDPDRQSLINPQGTLDMLAAVVRDGLRAAGVDPTA